MLSNQSDIQLLPYVEVNGTRTIRDEVVEGFFREMAEEGTHKIVFPEGKIKTEKDFLSLMKSDQNVPVFVLSENRMAGVAWLNGFHEIHALCHFGVLAWARGQVALDAGRAVLDHWFALADDDNGPRLEMVIGMIPESNWPANAFANQVGFNRVGAIPHYMQNAYTGESEGIVIFYYRR